MNRAPRLNVNRNANLVRSALVSRPVNRALRDPGVLRNPATRALMTASLATAAWRHGGAWHGGAWRGGLWHGSAWNRGWWGHRHGGFGWVGPIFWPYAFYDINDYAYWGNGYGTAFWDYGYPDLYAGLFGPYGYDDLSGYAGYLPRYAGPRTDADAYASTTPRDQARGETTFAQMCGEDSRTIAGLPVDAFAKAIEPDDAQRAALEELANASATAAQTIRNACPADIALTAPRRLAAMQQRIEAMITAVQTVQPPLGKFYALLNDEQKAKLTALAARQRPAELAKTTAGSSAQTAAPICGGPQPGLTDWPTAAIERTVRPTDEQRMKLDALQATAAKAADMLKASCQPQEALTPPARLAAVGARLNTMLQAVKTVRPAMDDFYGSLNDEQKANFDAIGPQRSASVQPFDQPSDETSIQR